MEKFDSIIFITPNIGEYSNGNTFIRNLNGDELSFLSNENILFEYRKSGNSYTDCVKDLKEKMEKIKRILEE